MLYAHTYCTNTNGSSRITTSVDHRYNNLDLNHISDLKEQNLRLTIIIRKSWKNSWIRMLKVDIYCSIVKTDPQLDTIIQ